MLMLNTAAILKKGEKKSILIHPLELNPWSAHGTVKALEFSALWHLLGGLFGDFLGGIPSLPVPPASVATGPRVTHTHKPELRLSR